MLKQWDSYLYPLVGLWGLLFLASFIGNICVCAVFVRRRRHLLGMKPFNFFSLAIADLIFTISTFFYVLNAALPKRIFSNFSCKLFYYVINTSHGASVFNLSLLTYSRYNAVFRPLRAFTQSRRALRSVLLIWALALFPYMPLWYMYTIKTKPALHAGHCEQRAPHNAFTTVYYTLVIGFMYFTPLVIISAAYIRIFVRLQTRDQDLSRVVNRHRTKALKLLISLVALFFILWTPFNVMLLVIYVLKIDFQYRELTWGISTLLILLNSSINPLLYLKAGRKRKRNNAPLHLQPRRRR